MFASFQSIEQNTQKRLDERYQRTMDNLEKVKKEMRTCFESLEGSIKSLQRITEGRIKATDEKVEKEVSRIRSTLVLIWNQARNMLLMLLLTLRLLFSCTQVVRFSLMSVSKSVNHACFFFSRHAIWFGFSCVAVNRSI